MMRALAPMALLVGVLVAHPGGDGLLAAEPAAAIGASARANARISYPLPKPPLPAYPSPVTPVKRPAILVKLMSPFPIVRLAGRATVRGARIRILSVRAPAGARILVRCRGRRCPRRQAKRGLGGDRAVRFGRFERELRPGTILEVLVEGVGRIGKFTRFHIRRRQRPRRIDLCLRFGDGRGSPCPKA